MNSIKTPLALRFITIVLAVGLILALQCCWSLHEGHNTLILGGVQAILSLVGIISLFKRSAFSLWILQASLIYLVFVSYFSGTIGGYLLEAAALASILLLIPNRKYFYPPFNLE